MGGGSFVGLGNAAGGIKIKAASEDGDGNDGEAEEDNPSIEAGNKVETGQPGGVAVAKGLEHAAHAVDKVQAEEPCGDKVKARDPDVLEACHHHVVHVEGHDHFAVF